MPAAVVPDLTFAPVESRTLRGDRAYQQDPGAPALWARIEAALAPDSPIPVRDAAEAAGVRFSVLFRVRQGHMPDPADQAAIEKWLAAHEENNPLKEDR